MPHSNRPAHSACVMTAEGGVFPTRTPRGIAVAADRQISLRRGPWMPQQQQRPLSVLPTAAWYATCRMQHVFALQALHVSAAAAASPVSAAVELSPATEAADRRMAPDATPAAASTPGAVLPLVEASQQVRCMHVLRCHALFTASQLLLWLPKLQSHGSAVHALVTPHALFPPSLAVAVTDKLHPSVLCPHTGKRPPIAAVCLSS